MSFNNGKSLNIEEINDIEKAIEDFSEGNIYLQRLLLECYDNNIKTIACCAGHKEEESFPYIAFSYSEKNEQILYYLMSNLKDSGILFTYNNNSFSGNYLSLEFRDYNPKCFQVITDLLKSFDKTMDYYSQLPLDLQNYFSIISTINNSNLLNNDKISNYFQLHYIKDGDTYNYLSYSNNQDCINLLTESGFKIDIQGPFTCYYIDSLKRENNGEILKNLKNNLDKKLNETSISKSPTLF